MANSLPPLEVLDVEGDNASISHRWEKWKRALTIFLEAADFISAQKKRATLLHFGGTSLQEIYYNLPGAHVTATEGVDVFELAVRKLDEYFLPKQNRVYERHMFRLMKQEDGEKFDFFLIRLRKQADKCHFNGNEKEDHLIDQITEKCTSVELRKKILTVGDMITLERISSEANTLEVVNNQLENYGNKPQGSQEVNAIHYKKKTFREKLTNSNSRKRLVTDVAVVDISQIVKIVQQKQKHATIVIRQDTFANSAKIERLQKGDQMTEKINLKRKKRIRLK